MKEVRRTPILRADLEAYGYTEGCPRCDHASRYGYGRTGRNHSEQCRSRIYEDMLSSERGRLRISKMGQAQLELMTKFQELLERQKALQSQGEQVNADPEGHPDHGGDGGAEAVGPSPFEKNTPQKRSQG